VTEHGEGMTEHGKGMTEHGSAMTEQGQKRQRGCKMRAGIHVQCKRVLANLLGKADIDEWLWSDAGVRWTQQTYHSRQHGDFSESRKRSARKILDMFTSRDYEALEAYVRTDEGAVYYQWVCGHTR